MKRNRNDMHVQAGRKGLVAAVLASLLLLLLGQPALAGSDEEALQSARVDVPLELFEQVRGGGAPDADAPEVRLVAQRMAAQIEEQLVAGVARPEVRLEVHFEFDSDRLTDDCQDKVMAASVLLNDLYPEASFVLNGHTDAQGDADYNLSLSQRRGEAVRRAMVEQGKVAPERLEVRGHGEAVPIEGATAAENRRVILQMERR